MQPEVLPKIRTSAIDCTYLSAQEGTPQLGRQASRDGLVLCSWQLLSYAKSTVTHQKEYACEQLNRARLIAFAMPYSEHLDGIFDRNRRTRPMSNYTDAIYADQRHATVLIIIGLLPNRVECTFGELCAEFANRIPEELEFEPGKYSVGDCFSGLEDHIAGEPVADHHFSRSFKQVVSFDVTAKIESARF
jgi:hypothetical protein